MKTRPVCSCTRASNSGVGHAYLVSVELKEKPRIGQWRRVCVVRCHTPRSALASLCSRPLFSSKPQEHFLPSSPLSLLQRTKTATDFPKLPSPRLLILPALLSATSFFRAYDRGACGCACALREGIMASSLSAASAVPVTKSSSISSQRRIRGGNVSFRLSAKPKLLLAAYKGSRSKWNRSVVPKAQLNEVVVDESSNASATLASKSEAPASEKKEVEAESSPSLSEASIPEFMAQVTRLVKLVDSRDIVELQLKQPDCELLIRKKEALTQPPSQPPVNVMQPLTPAKQPEPIRQESIPAPPAAAPPSPPKSPKSLLPPLKSPMAGTFYRSPCPGELPFVKVGEQVKKGQVLCIIEAMKLMNEIEADQSGKIVEVLAEDGKPVSVDTPLFIIEP
ncbi:hypothetical protein H6P81_013563 [Aristolochia fimbriata]|uniref:Lipoyl-binding domain-containing protein n=1 Tax=Aristolochia fimbriata TaxID=158543 RepID=A0AAV7EF15_ARIFI|nr:hypothetical protein H6P81_013563 [Aristolochia fimbriata]